MALKTVSEIGLADATDILADDPKPSPRPAGRTPRGAAPNARRSGTSRPRRPRQPDPEAPVLVANGQRPPVPLADESTKFVQIFVPGELQERLADASHALAADNEKLRHQKTILAALVWRYVQPEDPDSLRELGTVLDGFLATDLSEAPTEIKVGGHMPFSLKYKLEGAGLRLKRTGRQASAKNLLSALIWRYVDPTDLSELVELLSAYHAASRPQPAPLA
jgi:hypothetical protein